MLLLFCLRVLVFNGIFIKCGLGCDYGDKTECLMYEHLGDHFAWKKSSLSPLDYQLSYCRRRCNGTTVMLDLHLEKCTCLYCERCHCERPACEIYNNCCPDISVPLYPIALVNGDSYPRRSGKADNVTSTSPEAEDWLEKLKDKHSPILGCDECMVNQKYLYIRSCLPGYKENTTIEHLCEHDLPVHQQTINTYVKVVDVLTNVVYRNTYCAQCNRVQQAMAVKTTLRTASNMKSYTARTVDEMLQLKLSEHHIDLNDFGTGKILDCTCNQTQKVGHCPVSNETIDEDVVRSCSELNHTGLTVIRILSDKIICYKNIFCAICNMNSYPKIQYSDDADIGPSHPEDLPMSLLLNFRNDHFEDVIQNVYVSEKSACNETEWSAPNNLCLAIHCAKGKYLKNGQCVEYLKEISGLLYYLHLWFLPIEGKRQSFAQIKCQTFATRNELVSFTDQLGEHMKTASKSCRLYTGIIYQFSENTTCFSTVAMFAQMIIKAPSTVTRNQFETGVVEIMEKPFQFLTPTKVLPLKPMKWNPWIDIQATIEELVKDFTETKNVFVVTDTALANASFGFPISYLQLLIPLSKLLLCTYVSFNSSDFTVSVDRNVLNLTVVIKLRLNNTIITFTDYQDFSQLGLSSEGELNVCVDLLEAKLKPESFKGKLKRLCTLVICEVQYALTLVCFATSFLCLVLTLLTYFLFPVLRSTAGKNNMSLSGSLLLAQVSLTVTSHIPNHDTLCKVVGMMTHYLWLWMFSWSFLCSHHMFQVFTTAIRHRREGAILKKMCASFALPVTVIPAVAVHSYVTSGGAEIGYGADRCYLDSSFLVGLTVVGPLFIITLSNLVFFLVAACKIYTVRKLQSEEMIAASDTHFKKSVYVKLSTVTGAFWTVAVLAEFLDSHILRCLSIILNGLQGVAIFVSFICNKRVAVLYRSLWQQRGRNETNQSHSGRVTTD